MPRFRSICSSQLMTEYSDRLLAGITETVSNQADIDDEMRYLVAVLRRL